MNKGIEIYVLIDPFSDEICYVGASQNARRRFTKHLNEAYRDGISRKCGWIRSVLIRGQKPKMVIVDRCPEAERDKREKEWIERCRSASMELTNRSNEDYDIEHPYRWAEAVHEVFQSTRSPFMDVLQHYPLKALLRLA